MTNGPKSIYSTPFYIFPNGYKMQLRLSFNKDVSNTYLSLHLMIMRGNFDGKLCWPFKCKITFTLVNQLEPNNSYSKSFLSNVESSCFKRPLASMNFAYGCLKFYSLDRLRQNKDVFIEDDILLIKIHVDLFVDMPGKFFFARTYFNDIYLEIPCNNDDANELICNEIETNTSDNNDEDDYEDISSMICCSDSCDDAQ